MLLKEPERANIECIFDRRLEVIIFMKMMTLGYTICFLLVFALRGTIWCVTTKNVNNDKYKQIYTFAFVR